MALYEVASGEIAANIKYQVVGGTSITYNSVVYNAGDFFTGVSGVTTYTKTGGTEIVVEVSTYLGQTLGIENDFFTDLYNDSSMFLGISLEIAKSTIGRTQIIRTKR